MGEVVTTSIDFGAVTTALNDLTNALKEWVTVALPYIVGVAAAFFAFYLIRVVIRLVRSASK